MDTRSRRKSPSSFSSLSNPRRKNPLRKTKAPASISSLLQNAIRTPDGKARKPGSIKSTWIGDESDTEISPAYLSKLKSERLERQAQQGNQPTSLHDIKKPAVTPAPANTTSDKEPPSLLQNATQKVKTFMGGALLSPSQKRTPPTTNLRQNQPSESLTSTKQQLVSSAPSLQQSEVPTTPTSITAAQDTNELEEDQLEDPQEGKQEPYYDDATVDGWTLNDDELESEDDANTIESDKTSVVKKKDAKKVVPPKYIRYQLMIPPDATTTITDVAQADYGSNAQRIRDILISLTTQLQILDDGCKIISWKAGEKFSFLNTNEFPEDVAAIAKFFKGYRKGMKEDRRAYIRFGLHTPNNAEDLEKEMQAWAELLDYSVNRCLIQSDDAGYVGWICYSSPYTDIEMWRKNLMKITNYEWGFKLVPVTKEDKDQHWNKRLKAVGAFVPISHLAEAKYELSEMLLQANEESEQDVPTYTDRYIFVPPEETLGPDPDVQIAYKSFVARHRTHTNMIVAESSVYISINIDKKVKIRDGTRLTLRRMILAILVKDRDSPLYNSPLFHSVDFCSDTSKMWMGKGYGKEGAAYLFTFYKPVAAFAKEMVAGLGRYIAKIYGSELAKMSFDNRYWGATKGMKYHSSTHTFSTKQNKDMKKNFAFDSNLSTIRLLQNMELVEADNARSQRQLDTNQSNHQSQANGQDAAESHPRYNDVNSLLDDASLDTITENTGESASTSSLTRQALQEEIEAINRIREADRLLQQQLMHPDRTVHNVQMDHEDSESVLSSLTKHSNNEDDNSLTTVDSVSSFLTVGTVSMATSKHSLTMAKLESLIEPGMSEQEIRDRVNAYHAKKKLEQELNKEKLLQEYMDSHLQRGETPSALQIQEADKKLESVENDDDPPPSTPSETQIEAKTSPSENQDKIKNRHQEENNNEVKELYKDDSNNDEDKVKDTGQQQSQDDTLRHNHIESPASSENTGRSK